jgi:hypothetical protein
MMRFTGKFKEKIRYSSFYSPLIGDVGVSKRIDDALRFETEEKALEFMSDNDISNKTINTTPDMADTAIICDVSVINL